MADNYLERKMEEHLARKSGRVQRSAAGSVDIRLAGRRIIVAGCMHELAARVAALLARAGGRVALVGACAEGARCINAGADIAAAMLRIVHDWHEVDVLLTVGEDAEVVATLEQARATIPEALRSAHLQRVSVGPDDAADLCILSHQDTEAEKVARLCLYMCTAPAAGTQGIIHVKKH